MLLIFSKSVSQEIDKKIKLWKKTKGRKDYLTILKESVERIEFF